MSAFFGRLAGYTGTPVEDLKRYSHNLEFFREFCSEVMKRRRVDRVIYKHRTGERLDG